MKNLYHVKKKICDTVDGLYNRPLDEDAMQRALTEIGEHLMRSAGLDPEDLDVEARYRSPAVRDEP